jgi:hypothetical protein
VTSPPDGPSSEDPQNPHVRIVGGNAGWVPATARPGATTAATRGSVPILTPDALVRSIVGPGSSDTEVLVASSTVEATGTETGQHTTVLHPETEVGAVRGLNAALPGEGSRLVKVHQRAERWAPVASAAVGTLGVLVGLFLGAAAAYKYGDLTACADYAKVNLGKTGFGCQPWQRKSAILLPMIGLPLLVIGWLALQWIPERTGATRLRLSAAMVFVLLLLVILAIAGLQAAV